MGGLVYVSVNLMRKNNLETEGLGRIWSDIYVQVSELSREVELCLTDEHNLLIRLGTYKY